MGKTFFILFKEYEVKKDEGFLYIISESMESDQEQQCSSNNTDCAERTKGETVSFGMLILKQKTATNIYSSSTKRNSGRIQ